MTATTEAVSASISWIDIDDLASRLARARCYAPPSLVRSWTPAQQQMAYAWAVAAPTTWLGRLLFGVPTKPSHLP